MHFERPFDFLNSRKGKTVLIKLKDQADLPATLLAFDINLNLLVEALDGKEFVTIFIRGDSVISIS